MQIFEVGKFRLNDPNIRRAAVYFVIVQTNLSHRSKIGKSFREFGRQFIQVEYKFGVQPDVEINKVLSKLHILKCLIFVNNSNIVLYCRETFF